MLMLRSNYALRKKPNTGLKCYWENLIERGTLKVKKRWEGNIEMDHKKIDYGNVNSVIIVSVLC
jgi:hypothetical protein